MIELKHTYYIHICKYAKTYLLKKDSGWIIKQRTFHIVHSVHRENTKLKLLRIFENKKMNKDILWKYIKRKRGCNINIRWD